MNKEAHIWDKIVYHCLIKGKHMKIVTWDWVCFIYAMMCNDVDINMGQVIFSAKESKLPAGV